MRKLTDLSPWTCIKMMFTFCALMGVCSAVTFITNSWIPFAVWSFFALCWAASLILWLINRDNF